MADHGNIAHSTVETQTTIAESNFREYIRYRDTGQHNEYVKRAKKGNDYYLGKQWEEKVKSDLEAAGRPALTINLCLNKINTVAGEQISKRVDVTFKPKGNGASEGIASDLNSLFETIFEENQFEWLETEMFMDGIIEERGFLDLRLDFDEHIAGEARLRNLDNRDVLIDPDGKAYDPDTWGGIIETRLYSLNEIEAEWGVGKRRELESSAEAGTNYRSDSMAFTTDTTFGGESVRPVTGVDPLAKRQIRHVRVVSRQYYKMVQAYHFVDMIAGDMKMVPAKWTEEQMNEFAARNRLGLFKKLAKKIRWCISADHTVLSDSWSPFRHFTTIPYFCYFRRGKSASIMTNLISPQENLNKLSSQILHVVNSVANSGWIIEEDSLANMDEAELETQGSKTGLVISYKRQATAPIKIEPNKIPTGLHHMKTDAAQQMNEISGIDDVLGGTASAEFSGVALNHQEARGIRKLLLPIDNLRRTRWILARNLLDLIKDHYKEQRVIYITDKSKPDGSNRETKIMNQRDAAGRIINDITLGDYEIVIGSKPARDTFNDHQLAELLEFRQVGVQIPDHWMIRYSTLENKVELEQMLSEAAGFGEMTEEEQKAAQFQFEVDMIRQQAEIEEIEAKINDLDAKATLNEAKATDLMAGDKQSTRLQQREALEASLFEKKKERTLRRELHAMTIAQKENETESKAETEKLKITHQNRTQKQT